MDGLILKVVIVLFGTIVKIQCERFPDFFGEKELSDIFGPSGFNKDHPYRQKKAPERPPEPKFAPEKPVYSFGRQMYADHNLEIPALMTYSKGPGRSGPVIPLHSEENHLLQNVVLQPTSLLSSNRKRKTRSVVLIKPPLELYYLAPGRKSKAQYRPTQMATSSLSKSLIISMPNSSVTTTSKGESRNDDMTSLKMRSSNNKIPEIENTTGSSTLKFDTSNLFGEVNVTSTTSIPKTVEHLVAMRDQMPMQRFNSRPRQVKPTVEFPPSPPVVKYQRDDIQINKEPEYVKESSPIFSPQSFKNTAKNNGDDNLKDISFGSKLSKDSISQVEQDHEFIKTQSGFEMLVKDTINPVVSLTDTENLKNTQDAIQSKNHKETMNLSVPANINYNKDTELNEDVKLNEDIQFDDLMSDFTRKSYRKAKQHNPASLRNIYRQH